MSKYTKKRHHRKTKKNTRSRRIGGTPERGLPPNRLPPRPRQHRSALTEEQMLMTRRLADIHHFNTRDSRPSESIRHISHNRTLPRNGARRLDRNQVEEEEE